MLETIKRLVEEQTDSDTSAVTENSNIREDLALTSLDVVNLVMAIEDEFGITIPEKKILHFETIGDIIAYLRENGAKIA